MPQPGSTTARGYGAAHAKLRKEWAPKVARGVVPCARCHYVILKGALWDLGHDDHDRTKWTGPEHMRCNRAAGARVGNRRRGQRRRLVRMVNSGSW